MGLKGVGGLGGVPSSYNNGSPPEQQKQNEVVGFALKILSQQGVLSDIELGRLRQEAKQNVYQKIVQAVRPSGARSRIDRLIQNIQSGADFKAVTSELQSLVDSYKNAELEPDAKRRLSHAILLYHKRLEGTHFEETLAKYKSNKKGLSDTKIQKIIDEHNKLSSPMKRLAGTSVALINGKTIFYNKEGNLEVGPSTRKRTSPIVLKGENENLSEVRVQDVLKIYQNVANNRPYNNMAPLFEFLRFYRECRESNPKLTLKEAFESFSFSGSEAFDKYQSGDCLIVSEKLRSELNQSGINASIVGLYSGPIWSFPPIPCPQRALRNEWAAYDKVVENVHHCTTVVRFSDQDGNEKGLSLESGNLQNDDYELFSSWEELESNIFNKRSTREDIEDPGYIAKMQIRGKTKVIMNGLVSRSEDFKTANGRVFGIDLLRGNVYLNQNGAKGLKNLPTNENGRVSIELEHLTKPDEIGTYYIDRKPVQISHIKALEMVIESVKDRFIFPSDFIDNVLTLAQEIDPLFQDVLLPQAETARRVGPTAQESATLFEETHTKVTDLIRLHTQNRTISTESSQQRLGELREKLNDATSTLQNVQYSMINGDVHQAILSLGRLRDTCKEMNRTVNMLTENFEDTDA